MNFHCKQTSVKESHRAFALDTPRYGVIFAEDRHELCFLKELVEVGVLPKNGEQGVRILCALFVLPLDSRQVRSFSSMLIFTLGLSCLLAEETKFTI